MNVTSAPMDSAEMSNERSPQHIAVILPQNRIWFWHHEIISWLQQIYNVDVYTSTTAPRYPLILRLWIHFENYFFRGDKLVRSAAISTAPSSDVDIAAHSLILNLSEASIGSSNNICVIEPRYEGRPDSLYLLATLLVRKNPYISFHVMGNSEPIVASYLAIEDRIVLSRGLSLSFARLLMLAHRTACHLKHGTRQAILPVPANVAKKYAAARMWIFMARFVLDKSFARLLRQFQYREHWSVGLLQLNQWNLSKNLSNKAPVKNITILPDDGRRYYADPFLLSLYGQKWLFVEEYSYQLARGVISCSPIKDGVIVDLPSPALVRPYHLSYPFVFREGTEIYMIPETGSQGTVELYQARLFPFDWVLKKILLEHVNLYEATLLRHQGYWWMFGVVAHERGSAQDELSLYYSQSLDGPWNAHPLNPVKSDCRSARPAGHIVKCADRLLRPAQDCETGYGSTLVWLEIEVLTPTHFSEREIVRWSKSDIPKAEGMHTFNCSDEVGVVDFKRTRWRRFMTTAKNLYPVKTLNPHA